MKKSESVKIESLSLSLRQMGLKVAGLLIIVVFAATSLVVLTENLHQERLRKEAIKLSADQGLLIQRQLNQALSAVYALAAMVRQGSGRVDDFEEISSNLLSFYESVTALQLAPDAIVTRVVPLAGNEKILGRNLLKDEAKVTEIIDAIEKQQLIFAGPFKLVQGGLGVIARLPVYLEDPKANNVRHFWGFTIAVIKVDKLLTASGLPRIIENGYNYELWHINPDTKTKEVFARSATRDLTRPQDFNFSMTSREWTLSIEPINGWINYPILVAKIIGALAASFLLFFFGYSNLQPQVLRQMVNERTQELAAANETLRLTNDNLYQSEQKFRNLVENASDLIYTLDPRGTYIYVSPRIETMLGWEPSGVLGKHYDYLIHPEDRMSVQAVFEDVLTENRRKGYIEYRIQHKDGSWHWSATNVTQLLSQDNRLVGIIGTGHDITERKATELKMLQLAHFDSLTSLPNRTLFNDRITQALQLAQRHGNTLALLCVDIDYFKAVNDTYGHEVGDGLLKQVAQRMVACVRVSDTVARLGGDEFVVLLPNLHNKEEAQIVAEKIRAAIDKPFVIDSVTLSATVCIGVAHFPHDAEDETTLNRYADKAMYRAKESGRNKVCVYEKEDNKA